jgi:hypothetical protein
MCVVAAAVGAVAGGVGSVVNAVSGGGGGGQPSAPSGSNSNFNEVYNPQSLGQTLTGILGGGLSTALGISGLEGGNLNQLQAGAAAANPFGQYAQNFMPELNNLLQGGISNQATAAQNSELNYLQAIAPGANINTGVWNLQGSANIGTPSATNALTNLTNNPYSGTPASIQSILNQNPYGFTSGQQFQYQQGMNAVNATAAAQGFAGSGQQMVALENYGQGFANQAVQQNITNLLGAQTAANQSLSTQTGTASTLGSLLSQQQQNTFGNLMGIQGLATQQQQATQGNQQALLSQLYGIYNAPINANLQQLSPLLTATQATQSSPSTAGGILANLGVANQVSAGNLGAGLGGLANGLAGLGSAASNLSGMFGGGNNFTGAFNGGGSSSFGDYNALLYGPSSFGGGSYDYGGSNSYGFTL